MLHIQSLSVTPDALLVDGCEVLYWRDSPAWGPWPQHSTILEEIAQRQLFWKVFLRMPSQEAEQAVEEEATIRYRLQKAISSEEELVFWYESRIWSQCALLQVYSMVSHILDPIRFSVIRTDRELRQSLGIDQRVCLGASERQALDGFVRILRSDRPEGLTLPKHRIEGNVLRLDVLGSFFCGQFPSLRNGLSRYEERLLGLISGGSTRMSEIVAAKAMRGDNECGDLLDDALFYWLASCPMPLVDIQENENLAKCEYKLTSFGKRVLDGEADHASINTVDRWIGGTHVVGTSPQWRYDGDRGTLINAQTGEAPETGGQ